MANSIFQNLPAPMASKINPQMINSIKNMMSMFQGGGNPQAMLQNMAAQNPQFQNAMNNAANMVNSSNMSAKELFMKTAKEKGINPDDIINQLNIH